MLLFGSIVRFSNFVRVQVFSLFVCVGFMFLNQPECFFLYSNSILVNSLGNAF